ncbi:MAG: hypothetical protein OXH75_20110, partial [Acidobacteria bacterium]|nr:hypothetical protein [Acidobacteriota bacterium]
MNSMGLRIQTGVLAGFLVGAGGLVDGVAGAAPQAEAPTASAVEASGAEAGGGQRALLDRYCVTCHNDRLRTGGLTL